METIQTWSGGSSASVNVGSRWFTLPASLAEEEQAQRVGGSPCHQKGPPATNELQFITVQFLWGDFQFSVNRVSFILFIEEKAIQTFLGRDLKKTAKSFGHDWLCQELEESQNRD